jgi:hypothetical protein
VLGIVFLARNHQETRELKRQSEVLKREIRLWMRKMMNRKPGQCSESWFLLNALG